MRAKVFVLPAIRGLNGIVFLTLDDIHPEQKALLHALIPENVLNNMSSPREDLWADIQHTTIMFCSFDLDVTTKVCSSDVFCRRRAWVRNGIGVGCDTTRVRERDWDEDFADGMLVCSSVLVCPSVAVYSSDLSVGPSPHAGLPGPRVLFFPPWICLFCR